MNRLWVGNLPWSVTEDDIVRFFEPVCRPRRVRIMTDLDTGKPRGFAFVDVGSAVDATLAVEKLNRADLMGRSIFVNIANERPVGQGKPATKPQHEPAPMPRQKPRRGQRGRNDYDSDW